MVGIKDFGMPSCCGNCPLWSSNRWEHYCNITTYQIDLDEENRHTECPLVEAIPKADYKERLKADMVAMFEQIRAELIQSIQNGTLKIESGNEELFHIIDKYKRESEGKK